MCVDSHLLWGFGGMLGFTQNYLNVGRGTSVHGLRSTKRPTCLGYSVILILDCHLVEGIWYIYDWDTGSSILI